MYDDPVSRALSVIRQHYDDGGDVEPLMSRIMERVGDKAIRDSRVLEPEAVLKPGPEQSVWDKISSRLMGDRPSPERRRFVEGMGDIADVAHMGAYATPLAPAMGAVDFARGVASGDPTEAVLGATGLPGKAAKAAGVAASAMMPDSAEAGPLSNALKAIRAYDAKDALLALHGMKSHRMDMAEKLGGLPVPSIAIAKPEHGFKRFGDITLVGGKEMATPSRVNPVYGSDVYSPRFPSLDDEGNRIFRGFTNMGNRRYAPLTMENVVREMKGNVRGGENYNYGAGNVRAAVTPQFKTLGDVQNARGSIVTSEEFEPHKRGAQDYLYDLADRFHPYSKYSGSPFQHAGSFAETLSDVGKGRSSAWSQDYKELPDELKYEAMQYLSRLRKMPTEYFEAKPQRAVEFGEFSGAVVPENIMNDVEPRLKNLGVREIIPFNPEEEGAQQKAFREFSGLHFNYGGRAN
jgi:hypothetical protein